MGRQISQKACKSDRNHIWYIRWLPGKYIEHNDDAFESVVLIELIQELLLGTYDGITGIVTLPVRGAKEEGIIGFAKGIGQGIVGMPVKFWAGK